MKRVIPSGILASIMLLTAPLAAFAQGYAPALGGPVEPVRFCGDPVPLQGWASAEYLNWWIRGQPTPGPIVTTGDPASPTAGFLFDSSTVVLFGNEDIRMGSLKGGRITIGGWIDSESITGIEFVGFYLPKRETRFQAASDATGVPVLALSANLLGGGEEVLWAASTIQVANIAGSIDITTSSQFLGGELNTVFNAWRLPNDVLEFVVGFRYLNLEEDFLINYETSFVGADGKITGHDQFNTRNHFYGPQFGARWTGGTGRLSLSLAGLIGLGATHQIVGIDGNTTLTGAVLSAPGMVNGFFYTQPTNIGQSNHWVFSAVPQVQAKVGFDVLSNVRITFGYDFIAWTNVLRAANQIDRALNTTQGHPDIFFNGRGALVGDPVPASRPNGTNFWAQGVSGGLEIRW